MPSWEEENGWHLIHTVSQTSVMTDYPGGTGPGALAAWPTGYSRFAIKLISGSETLCADMNMYVGTSWQGSSGEPCVSTAGRWNEHVQTYPDANAFYAHLQAGRSGVFQLWAGNTTLPADPGTGVATTAATLEGIAGSTDHLHAHVHKLLEDVADLKADVAIVLSSVRKEY